MSKDDLRIKAEQGDPDAQYEWARHLAWGKGRNKQTEEAARWFQAALEQFRAKAGEGDANARLQLGRMYEYGHGVDTDPVEAARWYGMAAEQGSAHAQYRLGHLYEYGDGVEPDFRKAMRWYGMAAGQGEHNAKLKVEAREQWRRGLALAKEGHQHAQFQVGRMYEYGIGVPKDAEESAKWYRLAAEQSDLQSQHKIGQILEDGADGVPQDPEEAAKFFTLAAEQCRAKAEAGDADAMYELGRLYERGRGVEANHEEALKWFRLAAQNGAANAQYRLGRLYQEGAGVAKNSAMAARWYRQATRITAPSGSSMGTARTSLFSQ